VVIEMELVGVRVEMPSSSPIALLREVGGSRRVLPIFIGAPEATAIAMELAGKKFQRPLTHDLLMAVLNGLGAKVRRVEITDLRENTFYAKIYLEAAGELLAIDARPSDSIALAQKAATSESAPH
jgi:bifunctional DNase/RNase